MFFFFQAEDGIRDLTVTGVQTCALPIFPGEGRGRVPSGRRANRIRFAEQFTRVVDGRGCKGCRTRTRSPKIAEGCGDLVTLARHSSTAQDFTIPGSVVPHALPLRCRIRRDADSARSGPRTGATVLDTRPSVRERRPRLERLSLPVPRRAAPRRIQPDARGARRRPANGSGRVLDAGAEILVSIGSLRPGCQRRGSGTIQVLNLGVTSVITPWPRGRVSPYEIGRASCR